MPTQAVSRTLVRYVLDGIFPPHCVGCASEGEWLCQTCLLTIPFVGEVPCGKESFLEAIVAVSTYQHPLVGGLIRSFKYQRALCLEDEALRALLFRFGSEVDFTSLFPVPPTMIVPLAMDPERERVRGMDHAARLAQLIQSVLFPDVPIVSALARTRSSRTNAALASPEARRENLRDIFACRSSVAGESILLIDDVYTTGATLREASVALRGAEAAHIEACVLAQSGA